MVGDLPVWRFSGCAGGRSGPGSIASALAPGPGAIGTAAIARTRAYAHRARYARRNGFEANQDFFSERTCEGGGRIKRGARRENRVHCPDLARIIADDGRNRLGG